LKGKENEEPKRNDVYYSTIKTKTNYFITVFHNKMLYYNKIIINNTLFDITVSKLQHFFK